MINHKAIRALYTTVFNIIEQDSLVSAFDAQGNQVQIDMDLVNAWQDPESYIAKRAAEYPPITDYLDGVVKGDQTQIDKYIADCLAVKAKYPKG